MTLFEQLKYYGTPIIGAAVGLAMIVYGEILNRENIELEYKILLERDIRAPITTLYHNSKSLDDKLRIIENKNFAQDMIRYDSLSQAASDALPNDHWLIGLGGALFITGSIVFMKRFFDYTEKVKIRLI